MENDIDPQKVIASLRSKISYQALEIAEREALVDHLGEENKELKEELNKGE